MIVKINKNATIAVNLVKKFPADLDDIRLSLLPPIPKAPPVRQDRCGERSGAGAVRTQH